MSQTKFALSQKSAPSTQPKAGAGALNTSFGGDPNHDARAFFSELTKFNQVVERGVLNQMGPNGLRIDNSWEKKILPPYLQKAKEAFNRQVNYIKTVLKVDLSDPKIRNEIIKEVYQGWRNPFQACSTTSDAKQLTMKAQALASLAKVVNLYTRYPPVSPTSNKVINGSSLPQPNSPISPDGLKMNKAALTNPRSQKARGAGECRMAVREIVSRAFGVPQEGNVDANNSMHIFRKDPRFTEVVNLQVKDMERLPVGAVVIYCKPNAGWFKHVGHTTTKSTRGWVSDGREGDGKIYSTLSETAPIWAFIPRDYLHKPKGDRPGTLVA